MRTAKTLSIWKRGGSGPGGGARGVGCVGLTFNSKHNTQYFHSITAK